MEKTLLIGDHLWVDKLAYAPSDGPFSSLLPYQDVQRGDIVVFRYPLNLDETYVKRVIGVPGDRLRIANKQVIRNGELVQEPYKIHNSQVIEPLRDDFPGPPNPLLRPEVQVMLRDHVRDGELLVPHGCYFVMGDNRDNSYDSRFWGFVPRENIIGKPWLIYWSYETTTQRLLAPFDPEHVWDITVHFFRKTRWERSFQAVRSQP